MDPRQIEIRYGNQASAAITGAFLYLEPYLDANGDIIWVCGNAAIPTASTLPTGAPWTTGTLQPQYVPAS